MAKGIKNPLTEVLEEAEHQVRLLEQVIVEEYGIPLYTELKTGAAAFEWPDDPDKVSPEEMQVLVSEHGEEAVTAWINDFYMTKMQADIVAAENEETP